jgi:hypothetical protein
MTIDAFIDFLREQQLGSGVANRLSEPCTREQLAEWESEHTDFPLPPPYKDLLLRSDGLGMRVSDDSPQGLLTLLPLAEIRPLAQQVMEVCGLSEEDLTDPPTCLLVGVDQDSRWCLGLDTATGHFLEVAYTGGTTDLGQMDAFLDWAARLPG